MDDGVGPAVTTLTPSFFSGIIRRHFGKPEELNRILDSCFLRNETVLTCYFVPAQAGIQRNRNLERGLLLTLSGLTSWLTRWVIGVVDFAAEAMASVAQEQETGPEFVTALKKGQEQT